MDEVSHQLKDNQPVVSATYVPPTASNTPQQDIDYREKKKSSKNSNLNNCRIIPIHGECTCVDPRLRSKVRQLVLERLSNNDLIDRNEVLEELDHLVESHGRRLY